MLVALAQLEVLGLRPRLDDALAVLQKLGVAEVVTIGESGQPLEPLEELADLVARVEALYALAPEWPDGGAGPDEAEGLDDSALHALLEQLEPQVAALLAQREELRSEDEGLPRYIDALDALQPLVPELSRLDDRHLENLGLASVALVLDDPEGRIVPELSRQLAALLGRGHLMVTAKGVDGGPVGCMLVLRRTRVADVNALLGTERIVQVGVPAAYAGRSLRATVAAMRARRASLPEEHEALSRRLARLIAPVLGSLRATAQMLRARTEREQAARHADLSSRTFALRLWVPADQAGTVERELYQRLGSAVAVEVRDGESVEDRPVLLRNRPAWQPFQRLVGFLSWPARDGVDPTGLMAVVLPFFFGVMVGDVVYGLLLVGISWWVRRRWSRNATAGELGRVLTLGGWWAVFFGLLYGEALGSLGHDLGLPALWFYRGGPAALEPLLLFSLAIGLVHVVLGLLLGLWTAARGRQLRHTAEKAGTLLVVGGLFGLAGVAAAGLPAAVLTPAASAVIVGMVVACASQGALGLLLGPLELLGAIGNILSYLRLAAVGLASTYLAEVANQLGAEGPLLLGIVVAALFHSLNLALAAFSPMIQALRLHYVEFFGQFHEGGGRLFSPLGGALAGGRDATGPAAVQLAVRTTPEPVPAGSHV